MNFQDLKEFYAGKRVFVTGHTGFKGSWLCLLLELLGAKVYGYALEAEEESLFSILYPELAPHSLIEEDSKRKKKNGTEKGNGSSIAQESGCLSFFTGDVRNYDHLPSILQWVKPEIVFHLAAQPLVRESYLFPRETYETNVMGTVNLLESIRFTPSVQSVLNVTTDKVYENHDMENHAFTEEEKLDGHDPYSNSKSCSEILTHSYKKSFFSEPQGKRKKELMIPRISTARAGNVIGGGDFAKDRIIPDCVRASVNGKPIGIRNPYSVRPYEHVLEPLAVYLEIAARQAGFVKGLCPEEFSPEKGKDFAGYYNVGPDLEDAITTGELTELFVEFWGGRARWKNMAEKDAPHEAGYLQLNTNKLRRTFQWEPRYTVKEAVKETVSWYKAWANGQNMRAFSIAQIEAFFNIKKE